MKRVIIVPLLDATRFPDLEVIARDRGLAALAGDTTPGRTRDAYESDDSFLEAVARGIADRYTFNSLDEAARFAKTKLDDLAKIARSIEKSFHSSSGERHQPEAHSPVPLRRKRKA